jgi:hypothetical protein
MCNAWNHAFGCDCGWGGGYNGGRTYTGQADAVYSPISDYYVYQSGVFRWRHYEDNFCRPTYCPICREEVFFVRHNGGSVWFDSLGKPWPKHACFDTSKTRNRYYYHSIEYGWNSTYGVHKRLLRYAREYDIDWFGIVTEVEFQPGQLQNRLKFRSANDEMDIVYISSQYDLTPLIGEFVLVSTEMRIIIFVCLDKVVPFQTEPFIIGATYWHKTFGQGTLQSVRKDDVDFRVVVDFGDVGAKLLRASAANLRCVLSKPM